jgi:hypothetical protein
MTTHLAAGVKLMPHRHREDRVTQVTAIGPISPDYLDPADDPRTP